VPLVVLVYLYNFIYLTLWLARVYCAEKQAVSPVMAAVVCWNYRDWEWDYLNFDCMITHPVPDTSGHSISELNKT